MTTKIVIQNTTINYHFYLLNRMLKICGIYFDDNEKLSYKIYAGIVLSLTTLYPLFQLIGAFKYLDNGLEIFEFTVFEFTIILSKFYFKNEFCKTIKLINCSYH